MCSELHVLALRREDVGSVYYLVQIIPSSNHNIILSTCDLNDDTQFAICPFKSKVIQSVYVWLRARFVSFSTWVLGYVSICWNDKLVNVEEGTTHQYFKHLLSSVYTMFYILRSVRRHHTSSRSKYCRKLRPLCLLWRLSKGRGVCNWCKGK